MKVKDVGKAAAIAALPTVMWIVPAVAGQLGDRHDMEMLDQSEVTLSSGDTSVTLTAPRVLSALLLIAIPVLSWFAMIIMCIWSCLRVLSSRRRRLSAAWLS
ncbi:hypothetical protein BUE64_07540 [Corynebacterium diphtheriae subsp. lausannense]|nr:hypothetical protein BUE64_07540 [Corynebacterium diphtheriae subsp. lausannense]OWM36876.1 hypothetical protein AZF07_08355 [Corynebacterium diphtheriae subsp. lausannense]SNW31466.1 hypothetical protein FRC0043_01127 [Corynebacterium belfantii]